MCSMIDT